MSGFIPLRTVLTYSLVGMYAVVSIVGGFLLGKHLPRVEKWIVAWLLFGALLHITLEGPFLYLSLTGSVANSTNVVAELWKEMMKADSRWQNADPTIVSLEIPTVLFHGPLSLLVIYAIVTKRFYRHYVQIVFCTCELYGGWMIFCPEVLTGCKSLATGNTLSMAIYLSSFCTLWVAVPFGILYHSWADLRDNGIAPPQPPQPPKQPKPAPALPDKQEGCDGPDGGEGVRARSAFSSKRENNRQERKNR